MRMQVVPFVAVGMLAWGALAGPAQEVVPRPEVLPPVPEKVPETVPEKVKEKVPEKILTPPAAVAEGCHPAHTVTQGLPYVREFPVQILEAREIIQPTPVPTLVIALRPEKRVVTDIVMKPREVTREVCYTALESCVQTDPHTGECSTVLKPVTRTRVQKDLEFVAVPVERTVEVQVPFLKEVEEIVPRKTVVFEYKTVMEKRGFAVGIPGEVWPRTRYVVPPLPTAAPCLDGEHP